MTEKQREQLKEIEITLSNLSIGIVTHTANLRTFPNTKHTSNKYVRNCYGKPSTFKITAEHDILTLMRYINSETNLYAHDYTVLSYNGFMFTCGFVVTDCDTGEIVAYYYFTRTKSICYEF